MTELLAYIAANEKAIGVLVGSFSLVVALLALVKSVVEYSRQNALKRFEKFQEMRKLVKEEPISSIVDKLVHDDEALLQTSIRDRYKFLGFYEEIALMHDSKLISTEIAHYMFGYACIRCWESNSFWTDIDRNSYYWSLYVRFAKLMKKRELNMGSSARPDRYRF